MILLSHPTSNINAAATARGLYKNQLLSAYYTCISWDPNGPLAQALPKPLTRWLDRRKQIDVPSTLIKTRPFRELMRILCERTGFYGETVPEDAYFSTEQIYYDLDRHISRQLHKFPGLRGVYAYDDGALAQFQQAGKMGLARIYDLPIGHWRALKKISLEESEAQPEWAGTMKALTDTDGKHERKDAEIELADLVLVASTFTRQTLEMFPRQKNTVVVPYGMPAVTAPPRALTSSHSPLRVLFVGSLTQRKGLSYLLDTVKRMGNAATLTLIGTRGGSAKALDDACSQHRWLERLPHQEILAEMQRHDVFVFPSLFEGFGLVIGEALSQGLPVITTPHTGAPDIMHDGVEGFIVPIRSAEAIAAKLQLLYQDRELLKHMSDAARATAMETSWDLYENRVAQAVSSAIAAHPVPTSTDQVDTAATTSHTPLGQEFSSCRVNARR